MGAQRRLGRRRPLGGFLTAAKILALTGDIRRFPNQEHYASHAGTAPIDVSSGD